MALVTGLLFMMTSLEPLVTVVNTGLPLIVPRILAMIQLWIKHDFARRLDAALDHAKVSTRSIDRKRYLAHMAGVTVRHAGNYLSGEKMPTTEGMIDLALRLGVSWEWLATGRGSMIAIELSQEEIHTIQSLSNKDRERLFQIGEVLAHPKPDEQAAA